MPEASSPTQSVSVFRRRWQKFRTLKRGWYSFVVLLAAYLTSFFLFLLVNNQAILVHYEGETYFPAFAALFGACARMRATRGPKDFGNFGRAARKAATLFLRVVLVSGSLDFTASITMFRVSLA